MTGSQLQSKVRKLLIKRGAHVINTTVVTPTGTSDLIVCYQSKFIAIEIKGDGDTLKPIQAYQQTQVKKAGGYTIVATSLIQVERFLDNL